MFSAMCHTHHILFTLALKKTSPVCTSSCPHGMIQVCVAHLTVSKCSLRGIPFVSSRFYIYLELFLLVRGYISWGVSTSLVQTCSALGNPSFLLWECCVSLVLYVVASSVSKYGLESTAQFVENWWHHYILKNHCHASSQAKIKSRNV